MAQQTAVDWLVDQVNSDCLNSTFIEPKLIQQAKQMERERRKGDIKIGYNQGYLDAQCNHINDAENLAAEFEYLQSKIDNIDNMIKDKQNNITDLLINNFPENK